MSTFAGLRGTGDWAVDERPKNFRSFILWEQPNGMAPITALMSKMASESTDDPEFSWWEERLEPIRVQVNFTTGYVAGDTTITIFNGGLRLVPGDVIQVERAENVVYDNELIEVSSVTSDTVVVVRRGQAGSTAGAIPNQAWLLKVGTSFGEGTGAAASVGRNPVKLHNFTEIFKTSMEITRTARRTNIRTGDPWRNDKRRRGFDHSVDLETAFLFGRRHEAVGTNGKPKRFTGGLRQFITSNVTIFTTTPTIDTFLNAVTPVFNWAKDSGAGDERVVFCGNGALNSLNRLVRNATNSRMELGSIIKVYGMNLREFVLPQGRLGLRTHPLLNANPRYTNSMFILDPTNIKYRHILDTRFEDNIQLPGEDLLRAQWITEAGLEIRHERTMGYIGNFVV